MLFYALILSICASSSVLGFHLMNKSVKKSSLVMSSSFDPFEFNDEKIVALKVAPLLSLLAIPEIADANEYGILAGRSASMLHPITMIALLGTSLYSGYLGLQWRRLRGLSDNIKELQGKMPILVTTGKPAQYPIQDMINEMNKEWTALPADDKKIELIRKDLDSLKNALGLDAQIAELQSTRKALQGENLKDKHFQSGSILLGAGTNNYYFTHSFICTITYLYYLLGVTVSLLGAFNTYMRAGKLFPGPHLYAGMACTILWAVAAALVPAMQKGNEGARVAHIALNGINVALFFWQLVSGLDIMLKVWEKTSWP